MRYSDAQQTELIKKASERNILKAIEYAQTKLDEANSALMNARIFFYHFKHASDPKPLYTGKRKVNTKKQRLK